MNKALTIIIALLGALFVFLGLRWLVDPSGSAADLGMPLLEGLGRSTQIGDLGAFFFAGGAMSLIALVTRTASWFYAPALLLGCTALFRTIAWLAHGAPFAAEQIVVEIVVATLLIIASKRLTEKN
jgi:hypothetical protein